MHGERVPVDLVRETDDPIVNEVFGRLSQKPTGVVNIHRTIGNSPEVFSAFIGLAHALRFKTRIDPGERELAILRALHIHHGGYEIAHHRRIGAAAGLTEREMDLACSNASPDELGGRKAAVVAFGDSFARGEGMPVERIQALVETLDNRTRIELALTLALYVGLAHFTAAMDVPVD